MPPRHGKSELLSKYLPFWYLAHFPNKRIILSSYEATFAASLGKKVRDLLRDYGKEYFGLELDESSRSTSSFLIKNYGGGMSTAGAGGPITGKGADLFIIDDPVKNDTEANSPTIRNKIWDWFLSTCYTRMEPNGTIIIIMTRWHQDDLVGRIMENDDISREWKQISLPAIAESDDILYRNIGEPLWEQRFDLEKLKSTKDMIGNYWFSALYQQHPTPKDGSIFQRTHFKYYFAEGAFYYIKDNDRTLSVEINSLDTFISIDLAVSVSELADYTVAVVASRTNTGQILIVDVKRKKMQASGHLDFIKELDLKYKPKIIGIESVQYQIALIESAIREGLPVVKLKADKDKISRSLPMAAKIERGIVYFNINAPWLAEFERELLEFPNGKHDDQVDSLAYIERLISPLSNFLPVSRLRN